MIWLNLLLAIAATPFNVRYVRERIQPSASLASTKKDLGIYAVIGKSVYGERIYLSRRYPKSAIEVGYEFEPGGKRVLVWTRRDLRPEETIDSVGAVSKYVEQNIPFDADYKTVVKRLCKDTRFLPTSVSAAVYMQVPLDRYPGVWVNIDASLRAPNNVIRWSLWSDDKSHSNLKPILNLRRKVDSQHKTGIKN